MKKTVLALLSLAISNLYAGYPVDVNHLYVPTGFDSNDNSQIVVTGIMPNVCYQTPKATVDMQGNRIVIKVEATLYHGWNPHCDEKSNKSMKIPFMETVELGVLDKGAYNIEVINENNKSTIRETMIVTESSSNAVDEKVYAPVDYAIRNDEVKNEVTLIGYNPSDCYVLDKIETVSNKKDTYSVLPVMKKVSSFCPMKMQAFEYKLNVPNELNSKDVLLHIRRLEGKAVNVLLRNFNK